MPCQGNIKLGTFRIQAETELTEMEKSVRIALLNKFQVYQTFSGGPSQEDLNRQKLKLMAKEMNALVEGSPALRDIQPALKKLIEALA